MKKIKVEINNEEQVFNVPKNKSDEKIIDGLFKKYDVKFEKIDKNKFKEVVDDIEDLFDDEDEDDFFIEEEVATNNKSDLDEIVKIQKAIEILIKKFDVQNGCNKTQIKLLENIEGHVNEINDKEANVNQSADPEMINCLKDINDNIIDLHDEADTHAMITFINMLNSIAVFILLCCAIVFGVIYFLG